MSLRYPFRSYPESFLRNDARLRQVAASRSKSPSRLSSTLFSSASNARRNGPEAAFENLKYVSSPRFHDPFGLELIEQRRFDHGSASSQNLEQSWIIIPQTSQKLGHGEQVFVLAGRRVLIDPVAALADDRLGRPVELGERHPGDETDVARAQQLRGGDFPELGDPPREPPMRQALPAAQVDGRGGLDLAPGMKEQTTTSGRTPRSRYTSATSHATWAATRASG